MSNLIIVEGPDFSGKSTQIDLLDSRELYKDYSVFFTREPGSFLPNSCDVCEAIRKRILLTDNTLLEEAELFARSRFIHTQEIVEMLNRYKDATIICDRYIVSSFAYQGHAQGLSKETIYNLNKKTLDLLKENNITIHCIKFTMPEDEWYRRKHKVASFRDFDKIEEKDISEQVYEFFNDPDTFDYWTSDLNIKVYNVNAEHDKETVYKQFKNIVEMIREEPLWH